MIDWLVEKFWLTFPWSFEPVQNFFNGDFFFVLKNKIKKYPQSKILDLGCGMGTFLDAFDPRLYIGVDVNPSFIRMARKKYAEKNNVTFVCSDVLNYQTKEKFDLLVMVSMIHHFPDKQFNNLLKHLHKNVDFNYLIVIDGKPTKTIWKPVLQLLDLGGDFRDVKELKTFFNHSYEIVETGNLWSNKKFYYYPFAMAKKKRK